MNTVRAADRLQQLVMLSNTPWAAYPAGVHDPLRDPLVVEVEDLLAEVEVVEGDRATGADLERVLVVGDRNALLGGEDRDVAAGRLVGLAARAGRYALSLCSRGFVFPYGVISLRGHVHSLPMSGSVRVEVGVTSVS